MLPHFVTIVNEMTNDTALVKTKISALEVLNMLIKESESLDQSQNSYQEFAMIIKSLGGVIKSHNSQRAVVNPVICCI